MGGADRRGLGLVSMAPRLLDRIDAVARDRDIGRASLIALWLREKLDQEVPA